VGAAAWLDLTLRNRAIAAEPVFTADEFRLLPLRVHLLRSKTTPELNSKLERADAERILRKINGVWHQAGIAFHRESILIEEAAAQELYAGLGANRTEAHLRLVRPRGSLAPEMFHLYVLREMGPNGVCLNFSGQLLFVKDTAMLNRVPGGIDEDLPRVCSHEIGHALGLDHRQDVFNLMASGTSGTTLNGEEIRIARAIADRQGFTLGARQALAEAEKRLGGGTDASGLLETLAALPGGELAQAARRRLTR
jgi:hypothetical protein